MAKDKKATATQEPKQEPKKCPITRKHFIDNAKPLSITINGQLRTGDVKVFKEDSEGLSSFGFYLGDKIVLDIGGVPTKCQISCNIVVVGSKEATPE